MKDLFVDEQPSLRDLAEESGLPERTIRFLVQEDLLHGANRKGPKARYPTENLVRLQVLRVLQQTMTLSEIKVLFDQVGDDAILSLLDKRIESKESVGQDRGVGDYIRQVRGGAKTSGRSPGPRGSRKSGSWKQAPRVAEAMSSRRHEAQGDSLGDSSDSSLVTEKETWQRLRIGDDVEIHFRSGRGRLHSRRIKQLLEYTRTLFDEGE